MKGSKSRISFALLAGGALMVAGSASAQGWKPDRNVELTIPTSPGGSNDIAGRMIHKLWNDLKLLPVSSSVTNRSGGEHAVAYTYISQRTGDAHAIGVMSTPMLVNPIQGRMQLSHKDVTPIAYLITEPMVALVRADSPIKTGKGIMGPKGMTPAQVAFWEEVMRKTSESDEIRQYAAKSLWLVEYRNSADTIKWMDQQSAALKVVMTELGLAKQP